VAVSYAQFVEEFPEFANVGETVVQARLDMAALQVNASAYGGKRDMAIKYLAADLIARSPYGEMARLSPTGAKTIYRETFEAIQRQIPPGIMVV
jgi:hypothetical protein